MLLGKLSFFQASMILLLAIGLTNHVIVNPMLLDSSGRDAWIAILLTACLYLPWCGMLIIFMRRTGRQQLLPWLSSKTHPVIAWMLLLPVMIHVYLIGCSTLIYTETWSSTYYLPETPKFILVFTLAIVCYFYARTGLRAIAYSSGILLPAVALLGYFVSFANMPNKDYNLLEPMLEHGWQPAINGMIYAGSGFIELLMLVAAQHHLKRQPKPWQILLLALLLVYITIGPIIGAITEFGYKEAAKQFESPYEQWRLVKLGNDIEHVDFLSLFQWLAGAVIRISFAQFLLLELLNIQHPRKRNLLTLGITVSYILIAVYPLERYTFYKWMSDFYFPVSLIVTITIATICFFIALLTKTRKEPQA